jgi:hypothetical protein
MSGFQSDAKVLADVRELSAEHRKLEGRSQTQRAKCRKFRKRMARSIALCNQKRRIESDVVPNDYRTVKPPENVANNVAEFRCVGHIAARQPMYVGRTEIATGIDQRNIFVLRRAVRCQSQDCDFNDSIGSLCREASRFDIQHGKLRLSNESHYRLLDDRGTDFAYILKGDRSTCKRSRRPSRGRRCNGLSVPIIPFDRDVMLFCAGFARRANLRLFEPLLPKSESL